MKNRDLKGKFINKSDSERKVRSIRATDDVWKRFGELAEERGITRADLLEKIVENDYLLSTNHQVIILLEEALKLKANAGGAIKKKIKEVLLILSD